MGDSARKVLCGANLLSEFRSQQRTRCTAITLYASRTSGGYILSRARSGRARCILIVWWSALCLCPAHPSLKLQSGISVVLCQTFLFYLFPVQQTTIGIGHPVKSFFRVGNQYVECEKQQQQHEQTTIIGYHRKA